MPTWSGRAVRQAEPLAVEVAGRLLPLTLRRHARARRMILRLGPDGACVQVTLPPGAAAAEALAFARSRADWLARQSLATPGVCDPVARGWILLHGTRTPVDWSAGRPRQPVLADGALRLGGPRAHAADRVRRWLMETALRIMTGDAAHFCRKRSLAAAPVRLSRARRRWGSCAADGTIRLNWRLVQAPPAVRRAVVAHEVAHLLHFDHSPAFRACLDSLFEGSVADANAWLQAHGRSLFTLG
ncbi:DUF45 domain-containing protein [Erythrobacteraceae bacterium CFH 75059]|uniref:M48 family metallopeptidase n=1 Tax=Qipengyuania thermophila TaxID=2509361 RepID=UPI00101F3235|nr:YgjP-like metallopeptidase domain-containing protein [Qipengyuania thermophila]TCD04079.1 DUF45 domain-containing protein [Erythrobacteraceae bacterium CFH 75059]